MSEVTVELSNTEGAPPQSFLGRLKDNDLLASFLASKVTMVAGALTLLLFFLCRAPRRR